MDIIVLLYYLLHESTLDLHAVCICLVCGPESQCENGVLNSGTCRCDCPSEYYGLRCESIQILCTLCLILACYGSNLGRPTTVRRSYILPLRCFKH